MLEKLAQIFGFQFSLIVTGFFSGLLIVARKTKISLFTKVLYVMVCIFAAGYSQQVVLFLGFQETKGAGIVQAFIVSYCSTYLLESISKVGENLEKDPFSFLKKFFTKTDSE